MKARWEFLTVWSTSLRLSKRCLNTRNLPGSMIGRCFFTSDTLHENKNLRALTRQFATQKKAVRTCTSITCTQLAEHSIWKAHSIGSGPRTERDYQSLPAFIHTHTGQPICITDASIPVGNSVMASPSMICVSSAAQSD